MYKKTTKSTELGKDVFTSGSARIIPTCFIGTLVARQCTIIEALGLNKAQEEAIKRMLKDAVYDNIESSQNTYIAGDMLATIEQAVSDYFKENGHGEKSIVALSKLDCEITLSAVQ